MFTATSATCVTGLIVRDTWTQFTFFGQAVILLLIQVGGLGLVTLTSFFALAMRRRMGFRDLRLLGESVSADGYAQAKDVLKIVVGLLLKEEDVPDGKKKPSGRAAAAYGSGPQKIPKSKKKQRR